LRSSNKRFSEIKAKEKVSQRRRRRQTLSKKKEGDQLSFQDQDHLNKIIKHQEEKKTAFLHFKKKNFSFLIKTI
jgi:hypothetical protein